MSWRPAGRKDLPAILNFLLRDEALCVPFTSRLIDGARGCDVYFNADAHGGVSECILFTSAGLLLPVLAGEETRHDELADLLRGLSPAVHSIMGVGRCVRGTEELLPVPPTTRIEYFLMTLTRTSLRPVLPRDAESVVVRKADAYDAEALFPLQKEYELEEVVIDPSHFSDAQCMKLLKHALRDELVYVAELNGVPVAKAATNARGYKVDQIGGVYTVPEKRSKGLGARVVAELLETVFIDKSEACLFVKKKNRPALALYDRLGFAPVTDYIISYYGM
ncbi:MAG TPA: GNAT family N-acetyltransferase [Spirochaetia bacterium]|nr:GNAT family N-acetyltransferase [Spirochaetia bacterium]